MAWNYLSNISVNNAYQFTVSFPLTVSGPRRVGINYLLACLMTEYDEEGKCEKSTILTIDLEYFCSNPIMDIDWRMIDWLYQTC